VGVQQNHMIREKRIIPDTITNNEHEGLKLRKLLSSNECQFSILCILYDSWYKKAWAVWFLLVV